MTLGALPLLSPSSLLIGEKIWYIVRLWTPGLALGTCNQYTHAKRGKADRCTRVADQAILQIRLSRLLPADFCHSLTVNLECFTS